MGVDPTKFGRKSTPLRMTSDIVSQRVGLSLITSKWCMWNYAVTLGLISHHVLPVW